MIAVPWLVTSRRFLAAIAALLCSSACGGLAERTQESCTGFDCRPTATVSWIASGGRRPLDIVIVLDDRVPTGPAGPAFAKAMQSLAENMRQQMSRGWFAADIRIAMVPANLGRAGEVARLWPASPSCPLPAGSYAQVSELCDTPANFAGALADLLLCTATQLPPSGRPSRPIDTLAALLSPGGLAETTGFRRPQATLLLAIVTSEDDPSVAQPDQREAFASFLAGRVGDEAGFDLAVAAPQASAGLVALTRQLTSATPDDLAAASWPTFQYLGWGGSSGTTSACWDFVHPDRDGGIPPLSCHVVERVLAADGEIVSEHPLPACPAGAAPTEPCWRSGQDTQRCPVSGVYLQRVQPAAACRSTDIVRCVATCATPYLPASPLAPGSEQP